MGKWLRLVLFSGSAIAWGAMLLAASLSAQEFGSTLLDQRDLARAGLNRQWFIRATTSANYPGPIAWTLYVSPFTKKTVVEVKTETATFRYSDRDLDIEGRPLGTEGAQRKAQLQSERLTLRGQPPSITTQEIPDAYLVVLTPSATLECFEAETGTRLWSTQIGEPGHPVFPPAVSEKFVVVVHGTEWILLDRVTGDILWRKRTEGVPGSGPALSQNLLFVPMHNGVMEIYSIQDFQTPVSVLRSLGHPTAPPLTTPRTVAWATDAGHLYVGLANIREMRFRIETGRSIESQPAYRPAGRSGLYYIPSADGYLYCVDEWSGIVQWTYATGQALFQTPLLFKDSVLFVTAENNLYHLAGDPPQRQPELQWIVPGIRRALAIHENRVYAVGSVGQLVVVNLQSGSRIFQSVRPLPEVQLSNDRTNRIYVATAEGRIECLRPQESYYPTIHVDLSVWGSAAAGPQKGTETTDTTDMTTMGPMPGSTPPEPMPRPTDADPFGPPR